MNKYNKLNTNDINFSDFANPSLIHRIKYGGGGRQAIAKAIHSKNKKNLNIIDATAGLGTDTLVLASLNCQVYAIERNIKIADLLKKRLLAAKHHVFLASFIKNITIITGDSRSIIPKIIQHNQFIPDVIYLDPMFPTKKKTAAPNKQIQLLQSIIHEEPCEEELLTICLNYNRSRIVVKRPRISAYLKNIKPNFSLIGKANRFDIYLPTLK